MAFHTRSRHGNTVRIVRGPAYASYPTSDSISFDMYSSSPQNSIKPAFSVYHKIALVAVFWFIVRSQFILWLHDSLISIFIWNASFPLYFILIQEYLFLKRVKKKLLIFLFFLLFSCLNCDLWISKL